jgi:DNA helicase-2/ATP-dependent DNA helicase PcrA
VDLEAFFKLVAEVLGEQRRPNEDQAGCLEHQLDVPLLIVAGPGSGKTTVLVLRALRHVLVDRVSPEQVMITTFTNKAAKEIRTRLIEWGTPLIEAVLARKASLPGDYVAFIEDVDINRFVTGTLDSLCEEALAGAREPDERPLVVIESFATNRMLAKRGDLYQKWQKSKDAVESYLGQYSLTGDPPGTLGDVTRIIRTVIDRLVQDEVDRKKYVAPGKHLKARQIVLGIMEEYEKYLRSTGQLDFALLEKVFLERMLAGRVPELVTGVKVLLIDEYQDTNPLQERIYLTLAKITKASLTVVGDDDQSLYRFRGATIELFRDFSRRVVEALGGTPPRVLYLTANYRSTPEIVKFFNDFITNDLDFAPARIQPPKPLIIAKEASNGVPVLGMFRDTPNDLAQDLAKLLDLVFRRGGRPADNKIAEDIRANAGGGDFGDAVLLGSTVREFSRGYMGKPPKARFPLLLRQELAGLGVQCFNPRGRALKDIPSVMRMLGLVLECLDPSSAANDQGEIVTGMKVTNPVRNAFRNWRREAKTFLDTKPAKVKGVALTSVMDRWRRFVADGQGEGSEWPVLDVFYSLLPWIPEFQDDPECQVYLEAISRCAAQAATFSAYRGMLLKEKMHRTRSVQSAIGDVLVPVADDLVEVDEDIMPSVPRDRLNLMTIHQAKGLEFPLVIVDVGAEYGGDYPKQRFRRFPDFPSSVALMEDDLAPMTPIGPLRTQREAIQRSFEDLIRLYYVAYSRPQSILLLVGCRKSLRYNTKTKNVATFWRRDGTWPWKKPSGGGRPPSMADNIPMTML